MMKARAFNQIFLDQKKGCVTKASHNYIKMQDEVNYYLQIPSKFSHFFPDYISHQEDFSSYTVEYIPSQNLAELILDDKLSLTELKFILDSLFNILSKIHDYKSQNSLNKQDLKDFYVKKTLERLEVLKKNSYFFEMMKLPYIYINNKRYKNFSLLKEKFIHMIENCIEKKPLISMIHGDFCFSNILYCPLKKEIKLIDPRGSFGTAGIFGHSYYDYAKLMHCLHGKYDYIVNNTYYLEQFDQKTFSLDITSSSMFNHLYRHYHALLSRYSINAEFLYLIESSLFLSMAALHYEDIQRQKAFFLVGLMNLNSVLEGSNENLH